MCVQHRQSSRQLSMRDHWTYLTPSFRVGQTVMNGEPVGVATTLVAVAVVGRCVASATAAAAAAAVDSDSKSTWSGCASSIATWCCVVVVVVSMVPLSRCVFVTIVVVSVTAESVGTRTPWAFRRLSTCSNSVVLDERAERMACLLQHALHPHDTQPTASTQRSEHISSGQPTYLPCSSGR